jgi:arabinose-5-phosphate isomerase
MNTLIEKTASVFLDDYKKQIIDLKVPPEIGKAVEAVLACEGKMITTGMGKAGHAARKAASSLCSLTFPAVHLDPGDAAHGDVGIVRPEDVMLAFSTSGKTREVLEAIRFARNLDISKVISITSHPDGEIRGLSDIVLDMGDVQEVGHLGLAPTTSIAVMLTISDMLTLTASRIKGVTMEQYGMRHHGGYLGKKCRGEVG